MYSWSNCNCCLAYSAVFPVIWSARWIRSTTQARYAFWFPAVRAEMAEISRTNATLHAVSRPDDEIDGHNILASSTLSRCLSFEKDTTIPSDYTSNLRKDNKPANFQKHIFSANTHLLSISVTLGMLVIYIKSPQWKPGPTQISLLLIASKAHEWLIVGSLSIMLLHRVRVCLKSFRGIPLGFLAAHFQLSSAYYLFNQQFWEAATKSESNSSGDVTAKSFVLFTMYMAFVAGPSTGIVMLPTLDW